MLAKASSTSSAQRENKPLFSYAEVAIFDSPLLRTNQPFFVKWFWHSFTFFGNWSFGYKRVSLFLCKTDTQINGHATRPNKISPTRSLPIFAVYNTQQTKRSQHCARLTSKIYPALQIRHQKVITPCGIQVSLWRRSLEICPQPKFKINQ